MRKFKGLENTFLQFTDHFLKFNIILGLCRKCIRSGRDGAVLLSGHLRYCGRKLSCCIPFSFDASGKQLLLVWKQCQTNCCCIILRSLSVSHNFWMITSKDFCAPITMLQVNQKKVNSLSIK